MGNKGKQFELDTKRAINNATLPHVKAHRPDFSGNSAGEAADVMVVWQAERYSDQRPSGHPERHVAYVELKKRSGEPGKRSIVMAGSSQDQSGLEELQDLRRELPFWATKVLGIKFPHRELVVLDTEAVEHWLRRGEEGWGDAHVPDSLRDDFEACERHGLRLTPSDSISMVMPELDGWPSTKGGESDWRKLALAIGLEPYDFKVEENGNQ